MRTRRALVRGERIRETSRVMRQLVDLITLALITSRETGHPPARGGPELDASSRPWDVACVRCYLAGSRRWAICLATLCNRRLSDAAR